MNRRKIMIIKKQDIEDEKEKIKVTSSKLRDSITSFNETLDSVQEVIDGLKVVANTYGGHKRNDQISKIANIEIDKSKLASIADFADNIVVTDSTHKEYV